MPSPPAPLPPQIRGLTASLFPSAWTCRFQVPLGGTAKPPGKWAVPRCGPLWLWQPSARPPSPAQHAWAAGGHPAARRLFQSVCCRRLCWWLPSAPPQEAEGWGCRTGGRPLCVAAAGRGGPGGASAAGGVSWVPRLGPVSPPRFTFSVTAPTSQVTVSTGQTQRAWVCVGARLSPRAIRRSVAPDEES